jgi:hypothetical protein
VKFIHVSWVNAFLALSEESGHFLFVLLSPDGSFFETLNIYVVIISLWCTIPCLVTDDDDYYYHHHHQVTVFYEHCISCRKYYFIWQF